MNRFAAANENAMRPGLSSKSTSTVTSRRRVLGDITNSHVDEDNRNAAKKPAVEIQSARMQVDPHDTRIYMQRPAEDIDANARDQANPQMATEVSEDLYDHFFQMEREYRINPNYISRQEFINEKMRTILVDWLVLSLLSQSHINITFPSPFSVG